MVKKSQYSKVVITSVFIHTALSDKNKKISIERHSHKHESFKTSITFVVSLFYSVLNTAEQHL